ncbi:MAG: hypothetical protein Q7S22_00860 [Candidatus Micrarchaeota archaeon]|nr:hypothetical protein [Candidatus Micrarchaeota archaeon]
MISFKGRNRSGDNTQNESSSVAPTGHKPLSESTLALQCARKMVDLAHPELGKSGAVLFFGLKDAKTCEDSKDELKRLLGSEIVVELDFLDLLKVKYVDDAILLHRGKTVLITDVQTEAFDSYARKDVQKVLSRLRALGEHRGRTQVIFIMIAKPGVMLSARFAGNDALGNWCPTYNFHDFDKTEEVDSKHLRFRAYVPTT